MTPPANRSHKRLGIATVIVIAVALATGGTWAWFDFSQRFSNTFHALSESDYQPILVNEFDYVARTKTDWEVEVPVVKPVYITYDHLDPLYEASGGHLEDNGAVSGVDCSTYYKPTYVRVMLTETLKIHDLDGGATAQYGPWIYKGTESTYVTWTMGPDIVPVATWKTAYTGGTGPMTGPFWIRDTDGWFYWAEPLAHGDRTTTILESIKLLHLATYEELEYTVHIQLEAIDHGLRDLQKWRDPLESKNPTMGIDIRPLFGLTNFGVDNQGNNITLPITTGTNGNGPYFSPAIALDGINLMAAGHNATGSLSDGSFVSRTTPVHMLWDPVTLMTQKNVRDVRQGHRTTYILKSDGSWWAVGQGEAGQLSNGGFANATYPVKMMWDATTPMTTSNVKDLRASTNGAYILKTTDLRWYAVGQNHGQLADGTFTNRAYPVVMQWEEDVPILEGDISNIVPGAGTVFLLKSTGNTWHAAGANSHGQLSNGNTTDQAYPVIMKWSSAVNILGTAVVLYGYDTTTYLRDSAGAYFAVGGNEHNNISDGTILTRPYPVPMLWGVGNPMTTVNVDRIIFSGAIYILNKDDLNWYAQGYNVSGGLARGTSEATGAAGRYPQPAWWDASNQMTKANVKDIKPGGQFVRIQKQDNGWWAVGHNANGQLVDGTLINHSYPVPMIWADGSHIGLPPGTMPGDGMGG